MPSTPQTVTSGDDVVYTETITIDPAHLGGAILQCTVDFLLNGLRRARLHADHLGRRERAS